MYPIKSQPFASKILTNAISRHFKEKSPPKPLVMMLHGPTGVGKNYIANILAETMFQNGKHSRYVNYITSSYHFKGKNSYKHSSMPLFIIIITRSFV